MRCRRWGSPFQRSAVFNRRTWPLVHLTICSLRIRWSKNHTSRRRENPGHARHPAPQQFRFNQLWKWYEYMFSALLPTPDIHFEFQSRSKGQNPVFRGWVFRNLSMIAAKRANAQPVERLNELAILVPIWLA